MRLFDKILCPVDFSECSVKALQWAEYLGSKFGSNLTALHVHGPEFAAGTDPFVYDYDPTVALQNVKKRLETFLSPLKTPIETLVLSGSSATEIVSVADQMKATMIVMGTHGRKGLAHTIMGSTTEEVIRKVEIPVFTISPNATLRMMDEGKTALLPISDTKRLPTNFEMMRGILDEFGEDLTLMNVIDYHDDMFGVNFHASPYIVTAYETTEKETELLKIGEVLRGREVAPLIKFGDAADEILKELLNPKYGYLLLAVKKEKALSRFFESTAYRVISKAPVPVITVKL
jgi:universal stress protein A